jgi:hypothetical protein
MELFELLKKTISKMPTGWGETVKVDLTYGWTAPCDGLLLVKIAGQNDVAYIGRGSEDRYLCIYAYGGGNATTSGVARKGERYNIAYKGRNVSTVECLFTPFSYRGGYFSRLVKRLQSLTFKGVMA